MAVTRFLRKVFIPFSFVYGGGMAIRNLLYQFHIFKSHSFDVPVISVGNIAAGGTGKTPHIEFLVEMFQSHKNVAVLSRGYKRKTVGFRWVNENDEASLTGDEPLQIKQKFPSIQIAVDEDRVHGIQTLLEDENPPKLILLDDAFQHRSVKPGFQILLDNFNHPMHDDWVFPAGNLREFAAGKKRADIVIVTKCGGITKLEVETYLKKYQRTHPGKVFFSHFKYANPEPVQQDSSKTLLVKALENAEVLVLTGIANPVPFEQYVETKCKYVSKLRFPDHHAFSEKDEEKIIAGFNALKGKIRYLLTTEKDAVRLRNLPKLKDHILEYTFFIPIKVDILFNEEERLKSLIQNYVQ